MGGGGPEKSEISDFFWFLYLCVTPEKMGIFGLVLVISHAIALVMSHAICCFARSIDLPVLCPEMRQIIEMPRITIAPSGA